MITLSFRLTDKNGALNPIQSPSFWVYSQKAITRWGKLAELVGVNFGEPSSSGPRLPAIVAVTVMVLPSWARAKLRESPSGNTAPAATSC